MLNEKRSMRTLKINRAQRLQIVGATLCDERSVAAVYNGSPSRSTTHGRVVDAARRLKLPLPPAHNRG